MDVKHLKDACNAKYAQAIAGMEQGEQKSKTALALLDAAGLLVEISKADFSLRAVCRERAERLLSAARSLRTGGEVSSVYFNLTGRRLATCPQAEKTEEKPLEDPVSVDRISADNSPDEKEETAPAGKDEFAHVIDEEDGAQFCDSEQHGKAIENEIDGDVSLNELKGLLRSSDGKERKYGKESTAGYRFAWDNIPKISFDDVAGLDDVKEAVMRKVLLPLKNPELYEGYVKKNGGGLLLYGPPGTGKTMIAAAIAHEIGAKFCSLGPSDLVLGGIGNTEKACVALFKEARSFPCAVLFFDEIESICPVNTHAQGARQLRSELLRQIQGMEAYGEKSDKILFLIAATNKPWDIDPAFVRPGRFGTRIYVGLPDAPARRYMLEKRIGKIMQTGKVMIGDINADYIVEKTEGFNGADMTNLLDEVQELSALRSAKTGIKEILQQDFNNALKKVTSSVQQKDMQKLLEWKEQNG